MLLVSSCGEADEANVEPNMGAAETKEEADIRPTSDNPGRDEDRQSPVLEGEMGFFFNPGDRGPTLSYGVANTDNIAVNLRCPAGGMGETLLVYFNRPAGIVSQRPDTLTLAAGEAELQLSIERRSTQLGTTVQVQTDPASAPIRAYRRGASLKVRYGEETIVIPSESEDENVRSFFDACAV
ncbi:hypothetical protein D2V07_13630 [Aurantiacibacter zhengii]|uniref:Uncharacterized protein n=2 Tax=Aurantiacibacter zhengii TaxID=2307003 RepID=A0A418NQ70_9SPHN|nr:hypothetical protein D2V07_13630 [Aurantiacibacter zhengii]